MMRTLRLVALATLLRAPQALGCPVCYGAADDRVILGAKFSVVFMMGITYAMVLAGAGLAVVLYRRRQRRQSTAAEAPQS